MPEKNRTHLDLFSGIPSAALPSQPELTGLGPSSSLRLTKDAEPSSPKRGRECPSGKTLELSAGVWATPGKMDEACITKLRKAAYSNHAMSLTHQVSAWPTVVANDDNKSPEAHLRMKARMPGGPRKEITSLKVMVKAQASAWPTPAKSNMDGGQHCRSKDRKDELLLGGLVSKSGFSQEAFPASPPLAPASSEERKMTAGSGRRLSVLLPQSSPLGRCLKTLLESETWGSVEFCLRWKLKATKCGCSVFQLAPSARRIDGNDSGLWRTPQEHDRTGKRGKNNTFSDAHYYPHDLATATSAWPTPAAQNQKSEEAPQEWMDAKMLETRGKPLSRMARYNNGRISSGCLARTEKFAVRLITLSAWLMGYKLTYLLNWSKRTARCSARSAIQSSHKLQKES